MKIFFMKDALPPVSIPQPPKSGSLFIMMDFRVHNSLRNYQNYKLVLPRSWIFQKEYVMKDVLPIVPLLQSPKPGSPFTTGGF